MPTISPAEDPRVTAARDYLRGARTRKPDQLAPSQMVREIAELRRHVGQLLDARLDDATRLAAIRRQLAEFDWEFHDRQLCLERIEAIATGPADVPRIDGSLPTPPPPMCGEMHASGYLCTERHRHDGDHIARNDTGDECARWTS